MSDDVVVVVGESASSEMRQVVDQRKTELERMRNKLTRFMPRALEILEELAEGAENDRVRLAAAESILDRAGLGKTQTTNVTVSQAEHDIADREAAEMVARIGRQRELNVAKEAALGESVVERITRLAVLEGDDITLPTTTASEADSIETTGNCDESQ